MQRDWYWTKGKTLLIFFHRHQIQHCVTLCQDGQPFNFLCTANLKALMPRVMVQKGQHFEISATRGEGLVRSRVHLQFMISKLFEQNLKIWNILSSTRGNMIDLKVDFLNVLTNLVFVDLCYFSFSIFFSRLKEQKKSLNECLWYL